MLLEVQTADPSVVADLLNEKSGLPGASRRPDSVTIKCEAKGHRDGGLTVLAIALLVGKDVAVGVLAAWLYDVLKGRVSKLQIGGTPTPLTKESLETAITANRAD